MGRDFTVWGRAALPIVCAGAGALLYIVSPLSHQAFCTPLTVPVIVAPEGPSVVPGQG